jgi:hypothetical protein
VLSVHLSRPSCAAAYRALLSLGADPRLLSSAGWPALFYAVENSKPLPGRGGETNRHLVLVRVMLEADAADGVWATAAKGRTALMLAAMQDAPDTVRLLCRLHPWSLGWRDGGGLTAAHWAAVRGAVDALEALLACGCDPKAQDAQGKTPGQLLPPMNRAPLLRSWEAEREGAAGERSWDYSAVVEASSWRYMRKAVAAARVRREASRQACAHCRRWEARLRCGGCQRSYYCDSQCQAAHWTKGGHRLDCKRV